MAENGVHIVCTDEKTGIQALERLNPTLPMKPGFIEKREHSYKRHSTLCLTPNFDVVTGKILSPTIAHTRTELDFAEHIKRTIALDPDGVWIFILDQLNTHKSETLVKIVAKHCKITDELGIKGKSGILKSMKTRMRFLEDITHTIRFVYTPKHCSWLNQVEIWFNGLAKRVIKRGNFVSTEDLDYKLRNYIEYYNIDAKPYKWTYRGKLLCAA